ncbi:ribulose-phosphate 3-epimerase [Actinobaculum suis]|uniref:ribulose-phosphate 3-epimerase n=1 Tax=Actinobaculum suis TaxID=1657 RepID=UPI00066FD763|nr:ribulose-phosphate 3-epimerase [Actinobaculum suis]KMY23688.1 ribulose-phosphate 3-epimerase [Actinobaculum suis]OCA93774.1 ribulose-phosphate 3-epimerase [Actinobaculum suis]OCA94067.1 ribulose-phosphate 3-epimerase [Actinobaculum suis]
MSVQISPSILNCDFGHLARELSQIDNADFVHFDVMDNHFVPNLSFGVPLLEKVVENTKVPVDAHLMIEDPDQWAPQYVEAGAASVTFHAEACKAPLRLAREIRAQGARAGLALRPATDITPYIDILDEFDMILIMTVEPGFGGQKFISQMMPKVRRTREAIDRAGLDVWVQVDGGISRATIEEAARAGANNFVAGSAVFKAADAHAEVEALRQLATKACAEYSAKPGHTPPC